MCADVFVDVCGCFKVWLTDSVVRCMHVTVESRV